MVAPENVNNLCDAISSANRCTYADADAAAFASASAYHSLRLALAFALLRSECEEVRGKLIADLGGDAMTAAMLASMGYRVTLVNSGKEVVAESAGNGTYICSDLNSPLPFDSNQFDAIFAGEIIEHVFDPVKLLKECNRVLSDNGLLVITTPNLASLQDRWRFLFGYSPRHVDPLHEYLWLHIRPFTFKKLKECLLRCGFRIEAICSNYTPFFLFRRRLHVRWLARLFPTLGGTLIVAARKQSNSV